MNLDSNSHCCDAVVFIISHAGGIVQYMYLTIGLVIFHLRSEIVLYSIHACVIYNYRDEHLMRIAQRSRNYIFI